MPIDFSMLLGSSPPATTFAPYGALTSSSFEDCGLLVDGEPPYACRRVATFPIVGRSAPKPSNMKYRSASESSDLSKLNGDRAGSAFTLADLKRELSTLWEEVQQQQLQQQQHSEQWADGERRLTDGLLDAAPDAEDGPERRKRKKRVAFADDRGYQLVSIRVMSEPSDVPPKISAAVLRALLGDQWSESVGDTWLINFKQPASDYLAFRQKLETQTVAVENVLVKNEQHRLVGTVKVKNVAFEKQVFVRYTDNDWRSYNDRPCKYLSRGGGDAYDTFQFDFEIPPDGGQRQRLEFCVCYKANGEEFWDSNDGRNYEIISEQLRNQRNQVQTGAGRTPAEKQPSGFRPSATDALTLNCDNWTEFASWSDLSTNGPYW